MVLGTRGFIAWFEAGVYDKLRNACKNIFMKIFVYGIGVLVMLFGLYYLLIAMPSLTSIVGLLLLVFGLVVFVLPMGVK